MAGLWRGTKSVMGYMSGMIPGTGGRKQQGEEAAGARSALTVPRGPEAEDEEEMGEFGGGQADGLGQDGSLRTFRGHTGPVYAVAFAPGAQQFLSGGKDKTLRIWTLDVSPEKVVEVEDDTPRDIPIVRTIKHHPGIVLAADFSPTGSEIASSSDDGNVYLFEAKSTRQKAVLTGHSSKVYGVVFTPVGSTSPGEFMASCSLDKTVRLWSVEKQQEGGVLRGHTDNIFGVNFSCDGKLLASAGDDKSIILWDWRAGKKAHVITGHQATIWSVSWSHDDTMLVSTSMNHEVKLWDVRMLRCKWSINNAHNSLPTHQAIFSHDSKHIVSAGRDQKIAVYDTITGNRSHQLKGHTGTVYHLAMHPAGDRLMSSSTDTTMKLWNFPPDQHHEDEVPGEEQEN
ncbi:putative WD repeat-containing protein [Diplonema papillatum]|nr:putative WD repeat-containing protein [Diplonema papillatum]